MARSKAPPRRPPPPRRPRGAVIRKMPLGLDASSADALDALAATEPRTPVVSLVCRAIRFARWFGVGPGSETERTAASLWPHVLAWRSTGRRLALPEREALENFARDMRVGGFDFEGAGVWLWLPPEDMERLFNEHGIDFHAPLSAEEKRHHDVLQEAVEFEEAEAKRAKRSKRRDKTGDES